MATARFVPVEVAPNVELLMTKEEAHKLRHVLGSTTNISAYQVYVALGDLFDKGEKTTR